VVSQSLDWKTAVELLDEEELAEEELAEEELARFFFLAF